MCNSGFHATLQRPAGPLALMLGAFTENQGVSAGKGVPCRLLPTDIHDRCAPTQLYFHLTAPVPDQFLPTID
jgi:hypothetical protein